MRALTIPFEVIAKREPDRVVTGWAVLSTLSDGTPLFDLQGDHVLIEDLERVAWDYLEAGGRGGEMHTGAAPSVVVESIVFTPEKIAKLGIPPGTVPTGWLVSQRVPPEIFARVQLGDRLMFSIEGEGLRWELPGTGEAVAPADAWLLEPAA
jgi:hypothetical protein